MTETEFFVSDVTILLAAVDWCLARNRSEICNHPS